MLIEKKIKINHGLIKHNKINTNNTIKKLILIIN